MIEKGKLRTEVVIPVIETLLANPELVTDRGFLDELENFGQVIRVTSSEVKDMLIDIDGDDVVLGLLLASYLVDADDEYVSRWADRFSSESEENKRLMVTSFLRLVRVSTLAALQREMMQRQVASAMQQEFGKILAPGGIGGSGGLGPK